MTKTELYAAWERYMHRTDLTADLDMVYDLSVDRVNERLMFRTNDLALILSDSPRSLFHAGMIYLSELAQDDIQMQREMRHYEDAIADYSFRNSIDNTDPTMVTPYAS